MAKPANFDTMEAQMRRTYENAQVLLAELGGSLADVVEETLFVIDVPAAFAASGGSGRPCMVSRCRRLPVT